MRMAIGVEEARRLVLDAARLQPSESAPLADALGRTLAEAVVSRDTIPPFDNAAMDGFAVRTEDFAGGGAVLEILGEAAAGRMPGVALRPGGCVRIMTGAPIPDGADAVAPVEWTEAAGEDVRPGETLVAAGTVVTPAVVGMAATLGYGRLAVRVPPVVFVLATGDELVDAGEDLGPGQVRDANGPALAAQVVRAGGRVLGPFHVGDDVPGLRAALDRALAADVLVVSGGVSMGTYDLVRDVLDALGADWRFWKVRQRPGKPLAFGTLGDKPVFGLPGNPVSSAVCFEQYVRPALGVMLGHEATRHPVPAVLAEPVRKAAGLHHFVRGVFEHDPEGRLLARPTGAQGSNLYSSMLRADGFIHLPEDVEDPAAGTPVEVEWLRW